MTLHIVPLSDEHLADAAALFVARYRALRAQVPFLPSRYEEPGVTWPLLSDLAGRAPGVAALRGSRLAGFLLGMPLPAFRGRRAVYSPEWANGADLDGSREIYWEMYAHLAARWVANGCFTHLVSVLAHDRAGIVGWHWLGFGAVAMDAVRDLSPVRGAAPVEVRRAGADDIEPALALSEGLERHLAAAPTFLARVERYGRAQEERALADPARALWLAYQGAEAVGCMRIGPPNPDACTIIHDDKTASIDRAFTREGARRRGVAAALLDRALEWARAEGCERCAVDFEPMNVLAARFWTSHFQPVCHSLGRCVDERVAWANERRQDADMW